ncbi:hypothetical protein [Burkholderia sp. BCC0405]|uniref:hypothetical protein n=1 Tax=Burkholderia sp. BCC0405 TaxID=2676298 RepID=UPI00158D3E87|nr:hypothetical protein [Burkholderia sp. BCC0405]
MARGGEAGVVDTAEAIGQAARVGGIALPAPRLARQHHPDRDLARTRPPVANDVDRPRRVSRGRQRVQRACFGADNDPAASGIPEEGKHDGVRIMNVKTQTARNMPASPMAGMQEHPSSRLPDNPR